MQICLFCSKKQRLRNRFDFLSNNLFRKKTLPESLINSLQSSSKGSRAKYKSIIAEDWNEVSLKKLTNNIPPKIKVIPRERRETYFPLSSNSQISSVTLIHLSPISPFLAYHVSIIFTVSKFNLQTQSPTRWYFGKYRAHGEVRRKKREKGIERDRWN